MTVTNITEASACREAFKKGHLARLDKYNLDSNPYLNIDQCQQNLAKHWHKGWLKAEIKEQDEE